MVDGQKAPKGCKENSRMEDGEEASALRAGGRRSSQVKPSQTESNLGQTLVKLCQNKSNPLTISALPSFCTTESNQVKPFCESPSGRLMRNQFRVPSSGLRDGKEGRK